jgi:Arc/MetJ-type ribon-helix-helix transcriptional regulator
MQVLIQLDERLARDLDQVAPAKSRLRSEFIRTAIRKALMEEQERRTRERYLAMPDEEPETFDPEAWDVHPPATASGRPGRGRGRP